LAQATCWLKTIPLTKTECAVSFTFSTKKMAAKKDEKSPFWDDAADHLIATYGSKSHADLVPASPGSHNSVIVDYEPLKLSSFRVLDVLRGTVLQDPILLIEQFFLTVLFFAVAAPVYIYFRRKSFVAAIGAQEGENMRKWLDSQEGRMREFAMIMTVLASLLLSFYTAIAVTRWWAIRCSGVGAIRAAAMELEMLVSQMVTQEPQVLKAIRRYARASLVLVFVWRRKQLSEMKHQLVNVNGLLDEQEADQLLKGNNHPCLHETIWAWQSAIVCTLHSEGKIKSPELLKTLLQHCSDGRMGVQCIHTHLAVKIPMQYVHLLGTLVKMHNVVLAVIMGSLFGAACRNGEIIICLQLAGRTLILPLLFNAILLINAELSDPFEAHESDFPCNAYSNAIEAGGASFVKAGQNVPDWMSRRMRLPA